MTGRMRTKEGESQRKAKKKTDAPKSWLGEGQRQGEEGGNKGDGMGLLTNQLHKSWF